MKLKLLAASSLVVMGLTAFAPLASAHSRSNDDWSYRSGSHSSYSSSYSTNGRIRYDSGGNAYWDYGSGSSWNNGYSNGYRGSSYDYRNDHQNQDQYNRNNRSTN